jgi:hypothetical protein
MLKKVRKAIIKVKPLAFLLLTMVASYATAARQVMERSID